MGCRWPGKRSHMCHIWLHPDANFKDNQITRDCRTTFKLVIKKSTKGIISIWSLNLLPSIETPSLSQVGDFGLGLFSVHAFLYLPIKHLGTGKTNMSKCVRVHLKCNVICYFLKIWLSGHWFSWVEWAAHVLWGWRRAWVQICPGAICASSCWVSCLLSTTLFYHNKG